MFHPMRIAISVYLGLTILIGFIYPLSVTLIAQLIFPEQANGSLMHSDGKCLGSALIGQEFSNPKYFWGRPSATSPNAYNASSSGGSNLGPTNAVLLTAVKSRVEAFAATGISSELVPVDLVTASASGLDPEISPAAAEYQIQRVAKVRNMDEKVVRDLIQSIVQNRQFGVFGEPRVNVLKLNIALDRCESRLGSKND